MGSKAAAPEYRPPFRQFNRARSLAALRLVRRSDLVFSVILAALAGLTAVVLAGRDRKSVV